MIEFWQNHLLAEGAEFADGRVHRFAGATSSANDATSNSLSLCDLSQMGVIRVEGDDAASFLHAQLTNDVLTQNEGELRWNGWCSPKGRLLTVFLQWRTAEGAIELWLPKSLQTTIQKRLGMFVLRAKAKINDASDQAVSFGVCGSNAAHVVSEWLSRTQHLELSMPETPLLARTFRHLQVMNLTSTQVIVRVPVKETADAERARDLWNSLKTIATPSGGNAWHLAEIRDGLVSVDTGTQDLFVPQMVNFELTHGVSFKKGCYPGQEIVARTQYRGILKRRMVRVSFTAPTVPPRGAEVYSPVFGDQAAGNIVLAARADAQRVEALVVAQLDAIRAPIGQQLFIDRECTNALTIEALPYAIPDLTAAA
jgi:tRNA-modifying protein YgfZ